MQPARRVATLRSERGYLATIYDVSSAEPTKTLRRQFGEKYDRRTGALPVRSKRLSPWRSLLRQPRLQTRADALASVEKFRALRISVQASSISRRRVRVVKSNAIEIDWLK